MEKIVLPIQELLLLGVLIEAIVQVVKPFLPKLKEQGVMAVSMGLGILLALALNVTIFIGVEPYIGIVGSVMSGMIASRGANFIHNFIDSIAKINKPMKK